MRKRKGTPRGVWGASGRVLALALTLGPVAPGCALKSDIRDLQDEVRRLTARQDSALARLEMLTLQNQDSLREQGELMFEFRGAVARQLLDIEEQLVTIQELTGQSQRNLAALRDQMELRRGDVFETPLGETPSEASGVADDVFNAAVTHFNRGSNTTARSAFEQFLQAYPNHSLAPNAQFYLADILVQEDRLEEAIESFLRIPELYPTAPVVPDALYRVGALYLDRGDTAEGREYLERVVNSYPDSRAANTARRRLEEIR